MKKYLVLLILLFLVCDFPFAQDAKKFQIYLGGGLTFPSSPKEFTDYWKMGFNGGAGVGYAFTPIFSANASFDFNTNPLDKDKFLSSIGASGMGVSLSGGSINIITVMANIKATLISKPNSISPYLKAGAGLFSISATDITISYQGQSATMEVKTSEQHLGALFGAGIQFPVGPTVLIFVEGNYGLGFTRGDNTGYIPVKAGALIVL